MVQERYLLHTLLEELHDKLGRLKELTRRDARFVEAPNKIKVAIGMRGAGKTYFVYQYILQFLAEGKPKTSILYLNFEDDRLLPIDYKKLALSIQVLCER